MAKIGRPKGSTKIYSQDAFRKALNGQFGGPEGIAKKLLEMSESENPTLQAKAIDLVTKYIFGNPPQEHSGLDGGPIAISIIDTGGMRAGNS